MEFKQGKEFRNSPPELVIDHLRSVERKELEVRPQGLQLTDDGNRITLHATNGKHSSYIARKSFIYKLLRWYHFPLSQLSRLSADSITSICNDYLLSMKCDSVRLVVEDGDALTLRSLRYSEIRDLDVIELCGDLGITSISRNDLITRIYFDERFKIEPVPGDVCGLGFNVLNSETGFSALEVVNYLLRYTCSNGAVCPFNASTSRKYHYDSGKGPLKQFLKEQVESADRAKMVIIGSIRASLSSGQKPFITELKRRVSGILGRELSNGLFSGLEPEGSKYDLFNLITDRAKKFDINTRFLLEKLAGRLLIRKN